jgi:hypothetical protein
MNQEVPALASLAHASGRSLILPNVLGPDVTAMIGIYSAGAVYKNRRLWPGFRVAYAKSPALIEILEPGMTKNRTYSIYVVYHYNLCV